MTNVIVLEGNVVADATTKMVGDTSLLEFKLANTVYINKEKTRSTFILCKWWGARGASVVGYLQKGKRVTVTGVFEIDYWEKDGQPHSRPGINILDLSLGAKQNTNQSDSSNGSTGIPKDDTVANDGDFSDDIPF